MGLNEKKMKFEHEWNVDLFFQRSRKYKMSQVREREKGDFSSFL